MNTAMRMVIMTALLKYGVNVDLQTMRHVVLFDR